MGLDDQQEDGGVDEPFFDAQHDRCSSSTFPDTSIKGGTKSSEFDTEDDPMGPITPGERGDEFDDDDEDEDEDDRVDPPTPIETSMLLLTTKLWRYPLCCLVL